MNQNRVIYALLKGQCTDLFTAEAIGRSDIVNIGPHAKAVLIKIEELLQSQNTALNNLVSISLNEKTTENIFASGSSTPYGKFIFLLTLIKILTTHFNSNENGEIAQSFIREIQTTLDDENFMTTLFAEPEYKKLIEQNLNHVEKNKYEYLPIMGYVSVSVVSIALLAFTALKFKK